MNSAHTKRVLDALGADRDDFCEAVIEHTDEGHDGPGWYYWDAEYPEEGASGAFGTYNEALDAAAEAGYYVEPIKEQKR